MEKHSIHDQHSSALGRVPLNTARGTVETPHRALVVSGDLDGSNVLCVVEDDGARYFGVGWLVLPCFSSATGFLAVERALRSTTG